jgi:hypothetical protein
VTHPPPLPQRPQAAIPEQQHQPIQVPA